MTRTLVWKLIRDVRLQLVIVALLLAAFQCLWAKITQRITMEVVPALKQQNIVMSFLLEQLFKGPGKLIQTLLGGESMQFDQARNLITAGFVHPLMQTIFCVWAIGRSAGAVAGEIDRGTMELLLAQPLPRYRVILAHLCVDALLIPVLCLSLWGGNWLGAWMFGILTVGVAGTTGVDPTLFLPALLNVAALMFAVSGYTMWLSARGRFRGRVLGLAVLVTLLQFLVNVIGQLWPAVEPLRPFTVFYYFQPQQIILSGRWTVDLGMSWNGGQALFAMNVLVVLFGVGTVGYLLALWHFCRRDLPAPL